MMRLRILNQVCHKLSVKKQTLFSKLYIKPISVAFLVAMFNQFSGINAILYYAPRIFELSGLTNSDSMFQSILIGVTNGIFTILGLVLIDRAGRKKLLIIGSTWYVGLSRSGCKNILYTGFFRIWIVDIPSDIYNVFCFLHRSSNLGADCRDISKQYPGKGPVIRQFHPLVLCCSDYIFISCH